MAADDAIERGFQLAYFIIPSRTDAVEVLARALDKVSMQRRRGRRRAYWRDKYLKRGITRIAHQEADALQWLILFESDRFEKEQESRGEQTVADMAVRYIKSLVRITTAMSSFYVNIGLHRLLHNYTTAEIQQVYERVTERYLGADEYRRAKSVLMAKLERRFGQLLRTFRTQYGEVRFEVWDDQEAWQTLAEECLKMLTPWSTAKNCPVPADFGPRNPDIPDQLADARRARLTPDQLETNRCHAFIDPACYTRLTRALAFDPPSQRLALPRFFMVKQQSDNRSDPPPPLTPEERKALNDHLSSQSSRRRDSSPRRIRVVVDGIEQATLNASRETECSLEIEEGAEMIELLAQDEGEDAANDLLLAMHRVRYTGSQGIAPSQATAVLRGSTLVINITPGPPPADDHPRRAELNVKYVPAAASLRHFSASPFWVAAKYAVGTAALLAIGWIAGAKFGSNHFAISNEPAANLVSTPIPTVPSMQSKNVEAGKLVAAYKSYTLVSDDDVVRGAGGLDSVSVVLSGSVSLVRFDLPIPQDSQGGSFLVTLKPFQRKTVVFSEVVTPGKASDHNRVLSLWIPTNVLKKDQDYSLELRAAKNKGGIEETLSSYTFHTVGGAD